MYVNIISAICLAILVIEAAVAVKKIAFSRRAERIEFLRGFKRGSWALIFLAAVPLYFVGCYDADKDFAKAVFDSIGNTVELIVLKYDTDSIAALLQKNVFYAAVVYICFVLVTCNALLFTVSLAGQYIWEMWRRFVLFVTPRDVLVIYGLSEDSKKIYLSDTERCKIITDTVAKEDADSLYIEKISYISSQDPTAKVKRQVKRAFTRNGKTSVIINTGSEERNILCAKALASLLSEVRNGMRGRCFEKLQIYVIGDPEYQSVYEDIISGGYGCLRYVNKYRRVAVDFIDRYPFSKFMTEEHIDTDTALLRGGFDINVALVGFGRINREIFLTSVANNQFLEAGNPHPVLKKVRYHIFDCKDAVSDKNLNHSYYRYRNEFAAANGEEYLPLPELPAKEYFYRNDVNDFAFYGKLKDILGKNSRDVNFVIIAFGSDLENIDLAQKLIEKRREWGLRNLYIFVKADNFRKEDTFIEDEGCCFIGYGADTVYNAENIFSDSIQAMAKKRNESYEVERMAGTENPDSLTEDFFEQVRLASEKSWYAKSQHERDSSIFACLSIRSKLNLIGLDYVPKEAEGEALTYDEYVCAYAAGDEPVRVAQLADGKPVISYPADFPDSRRRNLAIHEHQRWNSFMISRGMVPSTLEQIKSERIKTENGKEKFTNGKNYAERRHGNLTTFGGLITFRKIISEREMKPEAEFDVIKYDYQLLDEAFWLLTSTGYKIIKNKPFGA